MVGPANLQPFARSALQEEKKSKKKKKEDKEMLVNIGDTIEKMRLVTRIFGERKGLPELGFNWI